MYLSTTGMATSPTPCSCVVIIILLRGIEDRGVETPPGYRVNHVPPLSPGSMLYRFIVQRQFTQLLHIAIRPAMASMSEEM